MSRWHLPKTAWLLLGGLLAFTASGCAGAKEHTVVWQEAGAEVVWPAPPEQPRVRFLRSFGGRSDLEKDEGRKGRFFRWMTGERGQGLPLQAAYGITADGEGRIWVADPGSKAVHLFDLVRHRVDYITTAGSYSLYSPVGVAWDKQREILYVSDSVLNAVYALNGSGELLGERTVPASFQRPTALALDGTGNLYVLDSKAGRVEVFSPAGEHLRTLGGDETGYVLSSPSGLAVDAQGRLYIVDAFNFRIVVLSPEGELLSTFGQLGDAAGSFARPRGVAVDSEGHIYVADAAFDNIQVFDLAGNLLLHFGTPGKNPGEFCLPAGLFMDGSDRLYAVDSCNFRIQLFQYLTVPPAGG